MAKNTPQLKLVLDAELAEAERKVVTDLAQIANVSVSTLLRRLVKRFYRKSVKGYNPDLFNDNHPGGTASHREGCTCIVCKQHRKE